MRPSQVIETLTSLIPTKQPVMLWGPPAIGKSSLVDQARLLLGIDLQDIRAVLLDPVDLRGLPTIKDGKAHWAQPDFLPTSGEGVLLLDELPQAPPLVQSACLQLTLDRKLGEYTLPDGWTVIAAGNRAEDRTHSHKLSTALSSRFVHLDLEVNNEEWQTWALGNGIRGDVCAFLRWKPSFLHLFNATQKTFPSPRTWEFVSRVAGAVPVHLLYEVVSGCIGEAVAAEYCGFAAIYRDLPDPDNLLATADTCTIPTNPSWLFALCGVMAEKSRAAHNGQLNTIATLLSRFPQEFGLRGVLDCSIANPAICTAPRLVQWLKESPELRAAILGA
jgi:hypothetical protein